MAHISLNSYLRKVDSAIQYKDSDILVELLSNRDPHVCNVNLRKNDPESHCEEILEPPYDKIVAAHLKCIWSCNNQDLVACYGFQSLLVHEFNKAFQTHKEENWALPVLYAITLDLRLFATAADSEMQKMGKGKPGEKLEKAAETLMQCFRTCASDTRPPWTDSKKQGMLYLVNQLFKIYFKINKLHLCKPLIRAIDSSMHQDKYSIAQRVTYKYYVGRKAMFEGDFKSAEEYLTFALHHCHHASQQNKRLILIYLLPVKMLLGQMPKNDLLHKYDLTQFIDIAKAVRIGNLMLLTKTLDKHEDFFIKSGVYLILEKLKIITYRNLFKKVSLIMNTHQLPVDAFVSALKWMGEADVDDDEVECILANLIFQNRIKGYISHQHKKLVISKQNAFPVLSA
ncbi:PCI domain-containing protein 2-like [Anneissia japonica]|uniref:PCI domain-containing protein 2-like n=1 Tax=Anneissia japonica TaxID=1529436 RepID=UPI001425B847|nr:PCI domain-containing protein 2-like [Anneissia japonica]